MIKYKAFSGLTQKTMNAVGTAPMKGPKNGMIFVMPMITATSDVYGKLHTLVAVLLQTIKLLPHTTLPQQVVRKEG